MLEKQFTTRVANPPAKPVLVYDGECAFCLQWVRRWQKRLGERVECEDLREASKRFPAIPLEQLKQSVHLVEESGRVTWGAEAVFQALSLGPGKLNRAPLWMYRHLPGMHFFAETVYKWVAWNRNLVFHLTRWLG